MNKQQAKQIVENYIRNEVKKRLNEEDWKDSYFSVYRKIGNNNYEIGKYIDIKTANKVAKFLQSVANSEYMSEKFRQLYPFTPKPNTLVKFKTF